MVSDIVLRGELPEKLRRSVELWAGCVAGAMQERDYLDAIRAAGFADVQVASARNAADMLGAEEAADLRTAAPDLSSEELRRLAGMVVSVEVKATKPPSGA